MNKRRIVLISISTIGAASAAGIPFSVLAQGQGNAPKGQGNAPKLTEDDPQAVSLGYKQDTTKVDQKRFPNHSNAQQCGNCQFYQGAASEPWAPCTIFGGKQVAAAGWCSAYVKKSG
jgi:hypothetical protein